MVVSFTSFPPNACPCVWGPCNHLFCFDSIRCVWKPVRRAATYCCFSSAPPSHIIIIILVALLLLKLGLGLFSPLAAHGLLKNESRSPVADLAGLGICGNAILSLYNGPISLSFTLLFLRGMVEISGSAENLSCLTVPSGFFSPARMARSRLSLRLWDLRRR